MPLIAFSAEKLATCRGGLVAKMIDAYLSKMASDLENAPEIAEKRKVTIEIMLKPIMEHGELHRVETEIAVNGKAPKRVASMAMFVRSNGRQRQFVYSEDAEDNPEQSTLPFHDQKSEE